jgi:hypothetical protein
MKIAFFRAHGFDIAVFHGANLDFPHELSYRHKRLHAETAIISNAHADVSPTKAKDFELGELKAGNVVALPQCRGRVRCPACR